MPNLNSEMLKCKHPNSRKTIALGRKTKRLANKDEAKLGQLIKQNIYGEKVQWFKENLPECSESTFSKEMIYTLIQNYLSRFDEELSQISLKHSIGGRKNRQHASREDVIKMTRQRETEEFETCGLEMPDLSSGPQVTLLKTWNGELRFLSNFKLKRYPKKMFV